jgi:hypothetical protein
MASGRKGIRGGIRIPVELPVEIRWKTRGGTEKFAEGRTQNMSGNGLFIMVPVRLQHDTQIEFTVSLPIEVTHAQVKLQCAGRVVRQRRKRGPFGLAVVIDEYSFASTQPAG